MVACCLRIFSVCDQACTTQCNSSSSSCPEMLQQQAFGRAGPVCSSAGRTGSTYLQCNRIDSTGSRSTRQVGALAHVGSTAASSNANTVAVAGPGPRRSSSRGLSSRLSRKNTCVVRSVLADAPTQTVEGCPRGGQWQVHKFGGTCMASPSRLKAAAEMVSLTSWASARNWQQWWSNCCCRPNSAEVLLCVIMPCFGCRAAAAVCRI